MNKINIKFYLKFILFIKLLFLFGCTGVKEKIGIINKSPDEFQVFEQKPLDVYADEVYLKAMTNSSVRLYASEEQPDVIDLGGEGDLALAIDPLDGSSNIETNAPIGTIFGIYKSKKNPNETILQSGDNLIASGFFIYGPRLKLIFSIGNGTSVFQLNQSDEFVLIQETIKIPENTKELSINFSNYAFWPSYIKGYIEERINLYKSYLLIGFGLILTLLGIIKSNRENPFR